MDHQEASVILDTPIETQYPATDREESLVIFHFQQDGVLECRTVGPIHHVPTAPCAPAIVFV